MPSNHLILYCPLLLPPSIFPSIRVFSSESVLCIRWPNWSFSFSISPSNEYSELISFRIDWLDLLAVQGTRKSLLQHDSSKASILQCSAFFIAQLSCPSCWWCHPTISSSVIPFSSLLQSFPASGSFQMSQFFTTSKDWSFSLSISPSNEYSGLISFRMDWLDLLAVQGTLKSAGWGFHLYHLLT